MMLYKIKLMKFNYKKLAIVFLTIILLAFFSACDKDKTNPIDNEKSVVESLDNDSEWISENKDRDGIISTSDGIIATSMSCVYIFDKLDVDLIAVPDSDIDTLPNRYQNLPKIGMAMNPDMEKIKSLNPAYVFSPSSLIYDLYPKYEAAKIDYGFINLNNLDGMYQSIEDLAKVLGKKENADLLLKDYNDFLKSYKKDLPNEQRKKVLLLMGLPGSYLVATENSYAGSLIEMAGGINVYAGSDKQFLNVNVEDMIKKDPDIILRTSHAMPKDVMNMFKKEFTENDIWKHFRAVKNNCVYDLDNQKFGMSAKFNYKEALEELKNLLYKKDAFDE